MIKIAPPWVIRKGELDSGLGIRGVHAFLRSRVCVLPSSLTQLMPGLTFVHRSEDPVEATSVRGTVASVPSSPDAVSDLSHEILYSAPQAVLVVSHYPGYPWSWIETPEFQIALEGRIHDPVGPPEQFLPQIGRTLFRSDALVDAVRSWLPTVDGDFVLWIREKESGRVILLNDILGRLPLYMTTGPTAASGSIVSRSVQAAARLAEVSSPDRVGMAHLLLFGYPLGQRTLFRGIQRVPPATVLGPKPASTHSVLDPIQKGISATSEESTERHARRLAGRFQVACSRRADRASRPVLGLSGGLDSRAVLAGFDATGKTESLRTVTFARSDGSNAEDVEYAAALARTFEVPWTSFEIHPPSQSSLECLLRVKAGLDSFEAGFMIDVLRHLRATFGAEATLFTGDGGDKLGSNLRPGTPLPSPGRFLSHLLRIQGKLSLETAANITGVDREALRNGLLEHVTAYTSSTWEGRYVEFCLRERALTRFFEGEDRNRSFLWHEAPFYAWPVVFQALQVPFSQKALDQFYAAFLKALSPKTLTVPRSRRLGTLPGARRYRLLERLRRVVHRIPLLHESLRDVFGNDVSGRGKQRIADRIRSRFDRTPALRGPLSEGAVRRVLDDPNRSRGDLHVLLTLTSFLETFCLDCE